MKTLTSFSLFAATFFGLPAFTQAAVIDLFTSSPQEWVAPTPVGADRVSMDPVPLTSSLFETRTLAMEYGAQKISIQDGVLRYETLTVIPSPAPGVNDRGYLTVTYSSDRPVNLLTGGATAFAIDFADFNWVPPIGFWLRISDSSGKDDFSRTEPAFGSSTAFPARLIIPFSEYPDVDLTAVQAVTLNMHRMLPGTSFTITGLSTVPEPSPTVLASVFCAFICAFRRRSNPEKI